MARSNPPGSLSEWLERAAVAPFRASINGDCEWATNRPAPDLISFSRMSPGGRMLLAFKVAEVRDYFVDGHLDQGAQPEPDNAARAGARRYAPDPMTSDCPDIEGLPLEKMCEIYLLAHGMELKADEAIRLHVLPRIAGLRESGNEGAAASLIKALPSDTVAKTIAWDAMRAVDPKVIQAARPAALDADMARLLHAWQASHRRQGAVGDIYGERAMTHGRQLFDNGRNAELAEFISNVRHPITRAFLADMAKYGTPKPASEDTPTP